MPLFVETTRTYRDWWILLKGALLALFVGTLLFCIVPTLAVHFLPLAGIGIH
jgi:hypothetical protein